MTGQARERNDEVAPPVVSKGSGRVFSAETSREANMRVVLALITVALLTATGWFGMCRKHGGSPAVVPTANSVR